MSQLKFKINVQRVKRKPRFALRYMEIEPGGVATMSFYHMSVTVQNNGSDRVWIGDVI